ncbi:MAG: hypothetical protein IH600_03450 [Bacteroidetes bacterium]|nr:hypothetical protein [Bacteroidota bacterium]
MLASEHIFSLLFERTAAGALVIAGLLALVSLLFFRKPLHRRVAALLLFVAAFSVYDVFGYDFIVMTDSTAAASIAQRPELQAAYTASLNAYRIVQVSFQFILSAAVLFAAGWRAMLAGNLVWWGAGCDLIYYAVTFRPLPSEWNWLWFTPLGIFLDSLSLPIVLLQCVVLTTTALLLISPMAEPHTKPTVL